MTHISKTKNAGPMLDMNMTPLIDVLLVLLIMFIITIPIATHAVEVDIGSGVELTTNPDPVRNKLVISANEQLFWNGEAIRMEELPSLLRATASLKPEPELQFEPDAMAGYEISASVLKQIKQSGVTQFGFVGNERHRAFGKDPS